MTLEYKKKSRREGIESGVRWTPSSAVHYTFLKKRSDRATYCFRTHFFLLMWRLELNEPEIEAGQYGVVPDSDNLVWIASFGLFFTRQWSPTWTDPPLKYRQSNGLKIDAKPSRTQLKFCCLVIDVLLSELRNLVKGCWFLRRLVILVVTNERSAILKSSTK